MAANVVLTGPEGTAATVGIPCARRVLARTATRPGSARTGPGDWTFHVEAWADPVATWYHVARAKIPAGQDIEVVFEEGADLLERCRAGRAGARPRPGGGVPRPGRCSRPPPRRCATSRPPRRPGSPCADGPAVHEALAVRPLRELVTAQRAAAAAGGPGAGPVRGLVRVLPAVRGRRVDRPGAPAAQRHLPHRRGAAARGRRDGLRRGLPAADPPDRHDLPQGPGQHPEAGEHDPGSPWAHRLAGRAGTTRSTRSSARSRTSTTSWTGPPELGLEVALDFALQCSPDHPWVAKHPEWFRHRAGRHHRLRGEPAEEVPGHLPDRLRHRATGRGCCDECERVLRFWMGRGVRIFRVDNPHTKPLGLLGVAARPGPRDRPRRRSSWPRPSPGRP